MPRSRLIVSTELPYHVTARANNREIFPLSLDELWIHCGNVLWESQLLSGVRIHSFVLMPNHFHLILTSPDFSLGKVAQSIMANLTKSVNRASGRSGHLFQGPYHRTLIESSSYYGHALKYVLRNPVKAGLCERVEDWPYSSLQFTLGLRQPLFRITESSSAIPSCTTSVHEDRALAWLNRAYRDESNAEKIREAFRKARTNGLKDRRTRKSLEETLLREME